MYIPIGYAMQQEDAPTTTEEQPAAPEPKRGRKRKTTAKASSDPPPSPTPVPTTLDGEALENVHMVLEEMDRTEDDLKSDVVKEDTKKRGRKPKGGKLVNRIMDQPVMSSSVMNVILHLKCTMAELDQYHAEQNRHIHDPLQYKPEIPPEIVSFDAENHFAVFESTAADVNDAATTTPPVVIEDKSKTVGTSSQQQQPLTNEHLQKLKRLKVSLYKTGDSPLQSEGRKRDNKKSACFWCTYDFDNDACYIPKAVNGAGDMDAYGSFCRPECAVGYLMNENIDDSTKFERYHLLNQVYGAVYGYKNNIKPAPNPYYLLDKFYGNQTIQEYRKLLGSDHLLYTLDKPMTRILPELHEVTDDFILGIYGTSGKGTGATQAGGVYKVKRQSEKQQGPSKASIIRGKFGMTQ